MTIEPELQLHPPGTPHLAATEVLTPHQVRRAPGSRIAANVLHLGVAQCFTWLATVGVTVILPRHLGDERLGTFNLAFATTELFGLIAAFGTATYLTREVARDPDCASKVAAAVITRVPLAIVAATLAIAFTVVLRPGAEMTLLVAVLSFNMLFTAMGGMLVAALMGLQEMRPVALASMVSKGVLVGVVGLSAFAGWGTIGVAVAWPAASALALVVPLFALRARGIALVRPEPGECIRMVLNGWPFFVGQASLMVYGQVDILLLSVFTHDAVIGWYGAAFRLINIPLFIPNIITVALFPALSLAATRDPTEFGHLVTKCMRVIVLTTVPIAAVSVGMAADIVAFLRYPEEFANSVPLIKILGLHVPLIGVNMVAVTVLNATNRHMLWALIAASAALINPALNIIAIPLTDRYFSNGAIGAAWATFATEALVLTVALYCSRAWLSRADLVFAVKCVAAAVAMLLGLAHLPDGSTNTFPLMALLGVAMYAAWSLLLGTLRTGDISEMIELLRTRRRGAPVG